MKIQDEQLRESLEEMLIDSSIDSIIAFDADLNILTWNARAEKIYKTRKNAAIGKNLYDVIPSLQKDEETKKAISIALKGVKSFVPVSAEHEHRRHAENHYIPLKNAEMQGVMNIVHDVAHRIKAEERLRSLNVLLEKRFRELKRMNDDLTAFTYVTSTNIKEPIRHMYTSIEWLIRTEAARLGDNSKAAFRRLQGSINRMDLLLDDILKLAQVNTSDKTIAPVDLDAATAEATQSLEKKIDEMNAEITAEASGQIYAYPSLVTMLLHHLLDNAIKFNKKSPRVKVTGEIVCLADDMEKGITSGKYYRLSVSDNGIGFDEASAGKIFNMFEKLNGNDYKGTGMGLAIARKIMEVHDGFILVEGKPGEGAAFHCYFPVNN